jgi:hypothetical protein
MIKISTGAWMACAAKLLLFVDCSISDRVNVIYPIIYDIILSGGFLYYWPTLLELVSRPRLRDSRRS